MASPQVASHKTRRDDCETSFAVGETYLFFWGVLCLVLNSSKHLWEGLSMNIHYQALNRTAKAMDRLADILEKLEPKLSVKS